MPNSNDAAKRQRQNIKRRTHNRSIKSHVRTTIKAFESALDSKEKAAAEKQFAEAVKLIDSAAGKGLYHKNTAARKKSRLYKKLAALV